MATGALLGCEHCGSVIRRVSADGQKVCASCGHTMRVVGLVEARELARERRTAERRRLESRLAARERSGYPSSTPIREELR